MRSLKTGLFAIVAASVSAMAAIAGCSADGGEAIDPSQEQNPTQPGNTFVPAQTGDSDDSDDKPTTKKDAGKDASKSDAAKDAGPPPPKEGDPCTDDSKLYDAPCGKCGKWQLRCIIPEGQTAGTLSSPGVCQGENTGANACVPGTTQACGNCGTQTCGNSCAWQTCGGQPANACTAGSVEYTGAGCPMGQYSNRTCSPTCAWGGFSATCEAPNNPLKLNIAGTAGSTVTGNYQLTATKVGKRTPSYCPTTTLSADTDYPYEIVELKNTSTTKTAKVSVWLSGPVAIDTVLASYPTNLPPTSDDVTKACSKANDQCSTGCTSPWSGLMNADGPTLAPGQAIVVRFGSWYPISDTDEVSTGAVTLNVRTDTLN